MSILPIQYTVNRLSKSELAAVLGTSVGASIGTPTQRVAVATESTPGMIGVVPPVADPVVPAIPASVNFPFEDGTTPGDKPVTPPPKPTTTEPMPGTYLEDGTFIPAPKTNYLPLLIGAGVLLWVMYA